jgi:hypothetical protein
VADTAPAKAPTAAIGYTHAPTFTWWLDENETTPELQFPMSVRVFDSMRRTDSQVTSVLEAVCQPVERTPWRIDPNGARDEVVQLVADDFGLPIAGQTQVRTPLRSKGRFSWSEHLQLALLMLPYGFSYFEQLYRVDNDGSRAHLAKLEFRPQTTIDHVEVATDGGLVYVRQRWTAAERAPLPIPVDRLVAYVHRREGGNWLGMSILRPVYKNWLLKDRLLRVQAQTIERNGMGIPVYEGAENEASLTAGLGMATSLRSGEAAGAATPFGAKLRLMGVEGTLPDAKPAIEYHDQQIARAVLAHFLNLGTQTGSWALGSTFADFFTLSLQTLAQQIADTTTQHVIEDLVDVNWGPDEPAPRLCFDEIGSRQQATAESLKSLVDAGILHPDEVLEGATRQFYGLPPADPATAQPTPGQPVGETVPPPTQTGEYSVAASALMNVDALDDWDLAVEALAQAFNVLCGEAVRASWDEAKHPRIPKGSPGAGRFLSMVTHLTNVLDIHARGGGKGDPFDGFDREQLRRVAQRRGLPLEPGASRDEIASKLLGELRPSADLPEGVSVTSHRSGRLHVQTPYDKEFVRRVKEMGGSWLPKSKTWSVPAGRAAEVDALVRSTYGKAPISASELPSVVRLNARDNGKFEVKAPFNNDFRAAAGGLGGSWDSDARAWVFPGHRENQVRAAAAEHFGAEWQAAEKAAAEAKTAARRADDQARQEAIAEAKSRPASLAQKNLIKDLMSKANKRGGMFWPDFFEGAQGPAGSYSPDGPTADAVRTFVDSLSVEGASYLIDDLIAWQRGM